MILVVTLSFIAALISIPFCAYCWQWRKKEKMLALALIGGVASILFSCGIHWVCYRSITFFDEVWNCKTKAVNYYEEWTEKVETTTTDDKGNTTTTTTYIYHPEEWKIEDEYGSERNCDRHEYDYWKSRWKNNKEITLWHINQSSWGDGNKWTSTWDGDFDSIRPESFIKHYENKIRVANTVWRFSDVDKATRKKFPRPTEWYQNAVKSYGVPYDNNAEWTLRKYVSTWGPKYEIHPVVLLFDAGEYPDRSIVETVINAWKGPNKNELAIFIGVQNNKVVWCDVASWMDDTTIHSLIRQDIANSEKFDLNQVIEVLKKYIPTNWQRKHFSDFSYIKVRPPWFEYLISVIISMILVICASIYVEQKL